MGWTAVFHDIFETEFAVLPEEVQDALLVGADRKFYQDLIRRADERYADHLRRQSGGKA